MSSEKSNYWKGVASRLTSLGRSVFDIAAPVAVNIGVEVLIGKACEKIETRLKQMYLKTTRNTVITFLINLVGILCLIYRPFGQLPSHFFTFTCLFAATIFFFTRVVLWVKEKGSQTFELTKIIIRTKSLHTGIEQYILTNFPLISLAYAGIKLGETYLPALKQVPRIPELIDCFTKVFWKRVVLFTGLVSAYTITVFWIIKPILINHFL